MHTLLHVSQKSAGRLGGGLCPAGLSTDSPFSSSNHAMHIDSAFFFFPSASASENQELHQESSDLIQAKKAARPSSLLSQFALGAVPDVLHVQGP